MGAHALFGQPRELGAPLLGGLQLATTPTTHRNQVAATPGRRRQHLKATRHASAKTTTTPIARKPHLRVLTVRFVVVRLIHDYRSNGGGPPHPRGAVMPHVKMPAKPDPMPHEECPRNLSLSQWLLTRIPLRTSGSADGIVDRYSWSVFCLASISSLACKSVMSRAMRAGLSESR